MSDKVKDEWRCWVTFEKGKDFIGGNIQVSVCNNQYLTSINRFDVLLYILVNVHIHG